jgi:hypothetical protein
MGTMDKIGRAFGDPTEQQGERPPEPEELQPSANYATEVGCPDCGGVGGTGGEGYSYTSLCSTCNGRGTVPN